VLELDEVRVPVTVIGPDGAPAVEKILPPHLDAQPWKALLDGMYERVEARGWPRETLLLGTSADQQPRRETVEIFQRIAPRALWASYGHIYYTFFKETDERGVRVKSETGLRVGQATGAWPPILQAERPDGVLGGWNLGFPACWSMRNYLHHEMPLRQWRMMADGSTLSGLGTPPKTQAWVRGGGDVTPGSAGFSRVMFDFWTQKRHIWGPAVEDTIYNFAPAFRGVVRGNSPWLIYAGPAGPVPTIRYEMVREGLQECEARIALERALLETPDALSAELKNRITALLTERTRALSNDYTWELLGAGFDWTESMVWGLPENWREVTARLFELAGEVQALSGQSNR
jgi:hypothetical protein